MREHTPWRIVLFATMALVLLSEILLSGAQQEGVTARRLRISSSDCTYLQNPDEFKVKPEERYSAETARTEKIAAYLDSFLTSAATLDSAAIPRKNLIDNAIFDRIAAAGIQPAPLASDREYLRRVMLDLTGRIPTSADLASFLNDPNPSKRDAIVDSL